MCTLLKRARARYVWLFSAAKLPGISTNFTPLEIYALILPPPSQASRAAAPLIAPLTEHRIQQAVTKLPCL